MSAPATRPREVVVSELSDDTGITMQAAADIIGCSVDTVRDLITKGYLDAWRIGSGNCRSPIRVRLGSVRNYRTGRTILPMDRDAARGPQRVRSARQREAFAFIQRLGKSK